jgi:hypothetical protein
MNMKKKPPVVSAETKRLAKYVTGVFGGTPHATEFAHDTEDLTIGLLHCADRPCKGVTSFSTIRLSDYPMLREGKEFAARIEIVGACASIDDDFANVLCSAAFCIMRTKQFIHPGACLENYVREYFDDTTVPHLYFTAPFLWELATQKCDTKQVAWLMAVPISDAEKRFLEVEGDEALEDFFEKKQIDVYDLDRPSVVKTRAKRG